VIRGVVSLARSAWRRIIDRAAPLPGLADVCPRALDAAWRRVGPAAVPVNRILGTASYPPGTRRRDFLPVRGYAPTDWQSRWDRLTLASANFAVLPPVGLVLAGDGYWVVDGHNRVALARASGQTLIDADVVELTPTPRPGTQGQSRPLRPAA
jgi:hypothetical protein